MRIGMTHRSLRLLGASVIIAGAAMYSASLGALAQSGPGPTGTVTSGCSTTQANHNCSFTFNFTLAGGSPAVGTTVNFALSGIATASVSPSSATVNANGNVQAMFSPGSGCGTATITATDTTTGATAQATVNVTCLTGAPLPNTSTLPPGPSFWWPALAGLMALVVLGGGVALRRKRAAS